jgi:hypothetical protein
VRRVLQKLKSMLKRVCSTKPSFSDPSCKEKKGECIRRAECIEKKHLYISRVCYERDLVCCYDDTIKFPTVAESKDHNSAKKI